MTDLPNLKLKTLVSFPANVNGGVGIAVDKEHGTYTIDMDWSEFATQTALPTTPTNNVLTYDTATDNYVMIPSELLGGTTAGISDAPVDGKQYGRQSGNWTEVVNAVVSDTAPVAHLPGDLWWNSSTGIMYIYYDDGTSAQWVEVSGGGGGGGGSGVASHVTVTGSDGTPGPAINVDAFVEINNQYAAGNVGGQLRFGTVPGSPFAMISARVLTGPSPYVGGLAFSMRENPEDANLKDRLYLTKTGMLSSTNLPGVNEGEARSNFSAYNEKGGVCYYGYSEALNYVEGLVTTPFYGVAENNQVGETPYVGVWGAYIEGRGGNSMLAYGMELDCQNTSGLDPKLVTPYDLFGSTGTGPTTFALISQAAGSKSVTTPKDASAWLVLAPETGTTAPNTANVRYWKGIVFNDTSLRAVGGHYEAINFPSNYEIAWYSGGANIGRLSSDGVNLLWNGVNSTPRERLTANRDYYVRTDGSDANSGLGNTAGGAFLTLQRAYNVMRDTLDTAGFQVNIRVADGSYSNGIDISIPWTGGGKLVVLGNTSNPANVTITKTTGDAGGAIFLATVPLPAMWEISGLKCVTTGSGRSHVLHQGVGTIQLSSIELGGVPASTFAAALALDSPGAKLVLAGPTKISASMPAWLMINAPGAYAQTFSHTLTLTGTVNFDWVGVLVSNASVAQLSGLTVSGAATGTRYAVDKNSVLVKGAAVLPGSTPGSASTGGQDL